MTSDDWYQRMTACNSPLGRRIMLAFVATDTEIKMTAEARKAALTTALGCTDAEMETAIHELERVGLAELKWFH